MKLFMVPLAPNPTKVMLYIAERTALGADLGIEQVVVNTLKGRQREPEHLARNPFGTLPVLELDDGSFLVESLTIIEYLEDAFAEHRLSTADATSRAKARDLERIADVRMARHIGTYCHATNSPLGFPPDPELAQTSMDSLQAPLDYLEGLLVDGRPLLTGETVAVADCTLQAFLQFARYVKADIIGDRPLLLAWDERYRARPSVQGVLKW